MKKQVYITDNGYKDLNPVEFGYENCRKNHFFGPTVRTYWLIHYVVSGNGIFKIDNKTFNVSAGEFFVIPPFVETYYQADSETPWSYIWIGFTSENKLSFPPVAACPQAEKIFQSMKLSENYKNGRTQFLLSKLWELFALLKEDSKPDENYVKKALDVIHSEYMHDISVEKIARRLNLERTYFSVLFKKETGISPKQYIINHRMNTAKSILIKKTTSVSVVAASVGYPDLFVFSKMFKRHFNMSPSDYIKKYDYENSF